jgi:hypothetical protein
MGEEVGGLLAVLCRVQHFGLPEQVDWNAVSMGNMRNRPSGYLSCELVNPRVVAGDYSYPVPINVDVGLAKKRPENMNDCLRRN